MLCRNKKSAYEAGLVHKAGGNSDFCNMNSKGLGVFPLPAPPLNRMVVDPYLALSSKFAGTHSCTLVKRGTVRVTCLAENVTQCPWQELEPGPVDTELNALFIRPTPVTSMQSPSNGHLRYHCLFYYLVRARCMTWRVNLRAQ